MVNVLHQEEYQRTDFNEMIKTTVHLLEDIRFDNSCSIFVDGANPSFISTLNQAVNEDPDHVKQIAFYKKNYPSVYDLQFLQQQMFVEVCFFQIELATVLQILRHYRHPVNQKA